MHVIERKKRYDGTVTEYRCRLVRRREREMVLLYAIPQPFKLNAASWTVHIPAGTYTVAYYWEHLPYNVYHWRTPAGISLGSYFNIVKDTCIAENCVSYTDMIVDVMVMPNGDYAVLDEDELPAPLDVFENGRVKSSVDQLLRHLDEVMRYLYEETDRLIEAGNIKGIVRS